MNSVIVVSRPPVLDCGTTFHLDYGGRDLPSTPSDNLWNLIYLATEALSDSTEFIGAIQINFSISWSIYLIETGSQSRQLEEYFVTLWCKNWPLCVFVTLMFFYVDRIAKCFWRHWSHTLWRLRRRNLVILCCWLHLMSSMTQSLFRKSFWM